MSDYFSQEGNIVLAQPADAWRVAEDIRKLLEILFGENWTDIDLEFDATSESLIHFDAPDLTSLNQQVAEFGGPMRDISLRADLWRAGEHRSCMAIIWFAEDKKAQRVHLWWHMPLRVDTESFRYGIERVLKDSSRRKRWTEAKLTFRAIAHQSEAGPAPEKKGPQLIRVRGIKWGLRRWFVENRDNIIVGLLVSTVVSVGVLVLQLLDLLPVPS